MRTSIARSTPLAGLPFLAGSRSIIDHTKPLPKNLRIVVASDDRHAPECKAGDVLIVDTTAKTPEVGCLFAIDHEWRTKSGLAIAVPTLQQCRPMNVGGEGFVLGASAATARRRETVDGIYDRAQFERAVLGRVVARVRQAQPAKRHCDRGVS